MKNIRNFCIIAHIDHGKSTLADRLLEVTKTVSERDMEDQVLDNMELERERGITIKSHAIQMDYEQDGEKYVLNLIDTPGHVDFSYEVSRSIAACEGALLIIDSTQGIQAQTISNLYLALEHDLEIIPVLNKMDLPNAMPEVVEDQIIDLIGVKREDIIRASGKTGEGIQEILRRIVSDIPSPKGDAKAPLQALIFDSVFNSFRGVIAYIKVVNGNYGKRSGDVVNTKTEFAALSSVLRLGWTSGNTECRDVGSMIGHQSQRRERWAKPSRMRTVVPKPIEGFEAVKPMVVAGVSTMPTTRKTGESMEKLLINDASLTNFRNRRQHLDWFRCGIQGMLAYGVTQAAAGIRYECDHDRSQRFLYDPDHRGRDDPGL